MALVQPDEFAGQEVARVYIAGGVTEARRVEHTLSASGVDYVVDAELYETNLLGAFPARYEGLAFYVLSGQAAFCRRILREAGLSAGLIEDEPE